MDVNRMLLPHLLAPRWRCPAFALSGGAEKEELQCEGDSDFSDFDDFLLPDPRRQLSDGALQNSELRRELECNLAEFLKRQLSPNSSEEADGRATPPGLLATRPALDALSGGTSSTVSTLMGPIFEDEFQAAWPAPRDGGRACGGLLPGAASAPALNGSTTLMIRHVPPKFTQRQLMRELNDLGFAGRFDFLYIPMDSRRRANRGIAFVNFICSDAAENFVHVADGRPLRHPSSQRAVEIMAADMQGFDSNVEHHAEALRNRGDVNKPLILRRVPAHPAAELSRGDTKVEQRARAAEAAPLAQQVTLAATNATPSMPPWSEMQQRPAPGINFCAACGVRKQKDYVFCPCCGFRFRSVVEAPPKDSEAVPWFAM